MQVLVLSYSGKILGLHDLSSGLEVQKAKVEAISQVPQPTNVSWL
jgi:hypothetical protein